MIVVSNTTPIISQASIRRIEILKILFGEILIPQAVYDEIKAKESYGYEEIDFDFIHVKKVKGQLYKDLLLSQLDLGETETILLAKELKADHVLIDENLAYKIAKNAGLESQLYQHPKKSFARILVKHLAARAKLSHRSKITWKTSSVLWQ